MRRLAPLLALVSAVLSLPATAQTLTRAPELLTSAPAVYPESERAEGREATVGMTLVVGADGTVSEVVVTESAGAAFDDAAVAAVRAFVFRPAEIDGVPAAVRIEYRYTFELEAVVPETPTTAHFGGAVRARDGGAPVPGVTVRIGEGDEAHAAVTDADGQFTFDALPPGTHPVELSGETLGTLLTEETLAPGEQLEVTYDVTIRDLETADTPTDDLEIVVTAPAIRRAAVSTEVAAEEARLVPGTSGDVVRVVESLPGVARSTAGSGALVVWGAAPDDTRIYVDGVPIPRLMHEGGLRSVIQPDFVTSVELVPGAYGPAWGRGLGGLVSIRTETPRGDGVHGAVSLDLLDASVMLRGSIDDHFRAAASARVSLLDLYAEPLFGPGALALVPIPRYRDGQARAFFDLGGGDSLELVGMLGSDHFTRGVPNADPALATGETRALDFQRISLRWTRDRGDGTVITVTPWLGHDERLSSATFGATVSSVALEAYSAGLRASWRSRLVDWLSLEVGLDAEIVSTSLRRRGALALPAREGDVRVFGQPPPSTLAFDAWTFVSIGVAPWVEADLSIADGVLHVTPGLRLDPYARSVSRRQPAEGDSPAIGLFAQDFRAEPRITVLLQPVPEVGVRAAFGLVHQTPSPGDTSATFGTPTLPPSEGLHVVVGATARLTETTSLEATGFFTSTRDLPMRSADSSPLRATALEPTGEGRNYGLQALVRQELALGLSGWVTYTLSRSERLDRPGAEWRLSDYDQTHVLTAVLAYHVPVAELDLSVRFRYATGAPRTPVWGATYDAAGDRYDPTFGPHNSIRIPDFVQLDVRIGRRFEIGDVRLDVSLEVLNAWNQANAEELVYGPDFSTRGAISGLPVLPVLGVRGEL